MGLSVEDLNRDLSKYESILKYLSGFTLDGRNIPPVNHTLLRMLDNLCDVSENEKIKKLNIQLTKKDKLIAKLEQELAELKENAIVPKFKIGQEVYSVFINRKYMECNEVCNLEITHIMRSKSGIFYQDNNKNAYWFNEKNTFLTEQEAQAKLQELRGEE